MQRLRFASALLATAFLAACASAPPDTSNTVRGTSADPAFASFEDSQLGFRANYPVSWQHIKTGSGIIVVPPSQAGGGDALAQEQFAVHVFTGDLADLGEFLDQQKGVCKLGEDLTVSGQPATEVLCAEPTQGSEAISVMVEHNDRVYQISRIVGSKEYDEEWADFLSQFVLL